MPVAILIFRILFPDIDFAPPDDAERARMCAELGLVCGAGDGYRKVGDTVYIDSEVEIAVKPYDVWNGRRWVKPGDPSFGVMMEVFDAIRAR